MKAFKPDFLQSFSWHTMTGFYVTCSTCIGVDIYTCVRMSLVWLSGSSGGCHVPCVQQQLGWQLSYRFFKTYGTSGNPKQGLPHQPPWNLLCWLERDLSFSFYAPPNMINEGENMPRTCLWSWLRDPENHDMARLHFKELRQQTV